MDTSKEKICHILQFFFNKGENASQAAENVNSVYGPDTVHSHVSDTVTANHAQFWFRRFRSGNFDVKDASRSGRPIVENVDKIMEIVESDRHVSTVSIAQELNIAQKTVWNHLNKIGYKKKLDVMDRISICESLLNRNKINPFLKRMVTGDEKWVTYDNVKRKWSWSNRGESAQTVAKPGLTVRNVLLKTHIKALATLKLPIDKWDAVLIFVAAKNLDYHTHKEWETHISFKGQNELPKIDELLEFLQEGMLEMVEKEKPVTEACKHNEKKSEKSLSLAFINNNECEYCKGHHRIFSCEKLLKLPTETRMLSALPKITEQIPQDPIDISKLQIPNQVMLAYEGFHKLEAIDLLIGAGTFWQIMRDEHIELLLRNCDNKVMCNLLTNNKLSQQLERMWQSEEIIEQRHCSLEERKCEEHFKTTMQRNLEGRFVVGLSQREDIKLAESYSIAVKRLYALENRFARQPEFKLEYSSDIYPTAAKMLQCDFYMDDMTCLRECILRRRHSEGATSGEYGGWGRTSHFNVSKYVLTTFATWDRALSCCKITLSCLSLYCGRLSFNARLKCINCVRYRSPKGRFYLRKWRSNNKKVLSWLVQDSSKKAYGACIYVIIYDGTLWLVSPTERLIQEVHNLENITELKKEISLAAISDMHDLLNKFSSITKLRRVIAYCMRFAANLRSIKRKKKGIEELEQATMVIKLMQRQVYGKEIEIHRKSKLLILRPFLDKQGLIRVGGRIRHAEQFIKDQTEIKTRLSSKNIDWKFIPPRFPNFDGLWEAAVKATKRHLYAVTRDLIRMEYKRPIRKLCALLLNSGTKMRKAKA
ncbi:SETMR methyltransferase, partial [Acromyrmex charruanus]